jgi:hypothetical protein
MGFGDAWGFGTSITMDVDFLSILSVGIKKT